jgi:hypothetical protein
MKAINFRVRRAVTTVVKGVLILAAVSAALSVPKSVATDEHSGFSERSIKGCYIEALSGTVLPDSTDPSLQLPIASLIRFCADGKGRAWVSGTQNIAGSCILDQEGKAEYSVDRKGTGTVTATLKNKEVSFGCAYLTPPIKVGDTAIFELRFGIQRLGGCLQTIGASLVLEDGPPLGYVAQGESCPQR